MMIPLKWILIYEAVVSVIGIIAALTIMFYKRRVIIESKQHDDDRRRRSIDTIKRILIHDTGSYEHYIKIDYSGRECDRVITFKEFYDIWIVNLLEDCYDFTTEGFQYAEECSMGWHNYLTIGFVTNRDIVCYRRWFSEQLALTKSATTIVDM